MKSTEPNLETPMMKQYQEIKKKYPDTILFFRMGDFYEMFFEDARTASQILHIALTQRQKGVPMAGIPYHALDNYLNKIIQKGLKVAICEQTQSVPEKGQKIVNREVTRIVTPGTLIEDGLTGKYLISLYINRKEASAIICDFGTGESWILVHELEKESIRQHDLEVFVRSLLSHYGKSEFLANGKVFLKEVSAILSNEGCMVNLPDEHFGLSSWVYDRSYASRMIKEYYRVISVESILGNISTKFPSSIQALGALLHYLQETQKNFQSHLKVPKYLPKKNVMFLDESAVKSLELLFNQNDGTIKGSLFSVLDHCITILGKRRLRQAILSPLLLVNEIEARLDLVSFFMDESEFRIKLRAIFANVADLEKTLSKICSLGAIPAYSGYLRDSLKAGLEVYRSVASINDPRVAPFLPGKDCIEKVEEIYLFLDKILLDKLPFNMEGPIIREGFSEKVDELRKLSSSGKQWLIEYQNRERKKTGISTLKVKYNRIFGYFIEISKGQIGRVPDEYFRKQTLVNAERFTTEELKNYETKLLVAEEKMVEEERKLFYQCIEKIVLQTQNIQSFANFLGFLDMFAALSHKAHLSGYCRPSLKQTSLLRIINGRHPVVEEFIDEGNFIPNDIILDNNENGIAIITGPNMAGKSTFIRQVALISLMAQIGSFVPASEAVIGICDRIFTRIGSGDNLAQGQSTFLVEMQETANIVNHFSSRSLIIFDEIGRGTSTYDGMSIAWSLIEYLASLDENKPRTLFATHFHELTNLAKKKGIFNLTLLVEENKNSVNFLRKVIPGSCDRSYGVHVAKLAGLPGNVIRRAFHILKTLENKGSEAGQFNFFEDQQIHEYIETPEENDEDLPKGFTGENSTSAFKSGILSIIDELQELNPDEMTPKEAMEILFAWKTVLNKMDAP